jgi:hypothetical protein
LFLRGMTPTEGSTVRHGQWVGWMLHLNAVARKSALRSIRRTPAGTFRVRIGGQVRGTWRTFDTRRGAEVAVAKHYTAALQRQVA